MTKRTRNSPASARSLELSAQAQLAVALGVSLSDSGDLFTSDTTCEWCGLSPFAPGSAGLCAGCDRCQAGKPSKTDPPLRQGSVVLDAHGVLHRALKPRDLWPWLVGERRAPRVISYSASYKRHHWRNAGVSSGDVLLVGGDDAQIRVGAEEREVLRAVYSALAHMSREEISTGEVSPARALAFGPLAWAELDALLAPHRASGLVSMACACAPSWAKAVKQPRPEEGDSVIDPIDKKAASLLGLLVWGSELRATDGKRFWGGILLHRVRRFSRLSLPDFTSRLMAELNVSITAATTLSAVDVVDRASPEEQAEVEAALRARPDLVCSLAFREIKQIRLTTTANKATKDEVE